MSWLWQQAMRWASARVWSEAKRAAASQTNTNDEANINSPPATAMAVVCESKRLFDAVADRLSTPRHVEGDRFAVCTGKLSGQRVVVARPLRDAVDHAQLITAIVDGHGPRFVLAAAGAASCNMDVVPGSIVIASRLIDANGQAVKLDARAPTAEGFYTGTVATSGASQPTKLIAEDCPTLAEDAWSEPIARACQQVGVAMMAASIVLRPVAEQRSREAESLRRQSTLAGRAGVLAGMLLKKQSGLRDVWSEKEAGWEACNRLATLTTQLARGQSNTDLQAEG